MIMVGTGSREVRDRDFVFNTLDVLRKIMTFERFHLGDARGADSIFIEYCKEREIPYKPVHKANWDAHGPSAGPIRNQEMLDAACVEKGPEKVCVVAFPHNADFIESKGTWNTIKKARAMNTIRVMVFPSA